MTRRYRPLPSPATLWDLFDYKPLTGELVWKEKLNPRIKLDVAAGCYTGRNAREVTIDNCKYLAHRLIWAWVTGVDPVTSLLDHKNRNPKDNRFWNLRLATQSQNMSNVTHTNPTGYKGVQRSGSRYIARLRINNKVTYLGTFSTAAEAGAAYLAAATKLHGEFVCADRRA
jgi:hypothetical protein